MWGFIITSVIDVLKLVVKSGTAFLSATLTQIQTE